MLSPPAQVPGPADSLAVSNQPGQGPSGSDNKGASSSRGASDGHHTAVMASPSSHKTQVSQALPRAQDKLAAVLAASDSPVPAGRALARTPLGDKSNSQPEEAGALQVLQSALGAGNAAGCARVEEAHLPVASTGAGCGGDAEGGQQEAGREQPEGAAEEQHTPSSPPVQPHVSASRFGPLQQEHQAGDGAAAAQAGIGASLDFPATQVVLLPTVPATQAGPAHPSTQEAELCLPATQAVVGPPVPLLDGGQEGQALAISMDTGGAAAGAGRQKLSPAGHKTDLGDQHSANGEGAAAGIEGSSGREGPTPGAGPGAATQAAPEFLADPAGTARAAGKEQSRPQTQPGGSPQQQEASPLATPAAAAGGAGPIPDAAAAAAATAAPGGIPLHVQCTAEALVEAEQVLRLQCLGPSEPSPLLLGSATTNATEASWVPGDSVTQFQSLLGEDAAAQESAAAYARAFLEGEPVGSLKNVVCSEVVLATSTLLLGSDSRRLGGVTDRWQRVVVRELRRLGLDAISYAGAGGGDEGDSGLECAAEDADMEVQEYLCDEVELERRRQELAAEQRVTPIRQRAQRGSGRRRSSSATPMAAAARGPSTTPGRRRVQGSLAPAGTGPACPAASPRPTAVRATTTSSTGVGEGDTLPPKAGKASEGMEPSLNEVLPGGGPGGGQTRPLLAAPNRSGDADELDIHPTVRSPPALCPALQQTGGAVLMDSTSQLDIQPTLLTAPQAPQPATQAAAAAPAVAAGTPKAVAGKEAADPFDLLLASQSQSQSQAAALPKANTQVRFNGSWWFGTSAAAAGPEMAEARQAAKSAVALRNAPNRHKGAVAFSALASVAAARESPQATGRADQRAEQGAACSQVPDTPPDAPSSTSPRPNAQAAASVYVSRPSPTNAASAVPAVSLSLVPASAAAGVGPGRVFQAQGAHTVPGSQGAAAPQAEPAPQRGYPGAVAGPGSQPAAASQAVDEAAVGQAMQVVALISEHFPATQEVLPGCPSLGGPPSQQEQEQQQQQQVEREQGPAVPPEQVEREHQPAVSPEQGAPLEQEQGPGPGSRQWKLPAQQQQAQPDSGSGGEEGSREQAQQAGSGGRSKTTQAAAAPSNPHVVGKKRKKVPKSERRRSLLAGRMAPVGTPRPDLAGAGRSGALPLVKPATATPAAATARSPLPAAAEAGLSPLVGGGRVPGKQAAVHAGAAIDVAPCSGLLDDVDLFASQHPGRELHQQGGRGGAVLSRSPAAQMGGGEEADPFRFPADEAAAAALAPSHKQQQAGPGGKAGRVATLRDLAQTAPSGHPPGTVSRALASVGEGIQREGTALQQKAGGLEEEEDEQQLLITEGPHPMVQTLPDGDQWAREEAAAWLRSRGTAAAAQQERRQAGPSAGGRPARHAKLPARYRNSPGKGPSAEPAAQPAPASPAPQQQQQQEEGHEDESPKSGWRTRKRAAAEEPVRGKRARLSPRPPGIVVAAARDDAGAAAAAGLLVVVPDSEDQVVAEYLRTHHLGCSKCRHSPGGCGKCRAERQEAIERILQSRATGVPAPASYPGAAAAGGGQRSGATPAVKQAQQQRRRQDKEQESEEEEVEGPTQELGRSPAAGPPAQPPRKRGRPPGKTAAAAAAVAMPVAQQPQAARPASGRRRSGVWAAMPGPAPSSGRMFDGASFMVTGFAERLEEKRALLALLEQQGASVLEEVPPPPAQQPAEGRRHSGRPVPCPGSLIAVLSDRKLRTPKFLYAVVKGLPVLSGQWVTDCVAAGKQLPPCPCAHLLHQPTAKQGQEAPAPAFSGLRVYLHGAKSFTQPFSQLLQHAGAAISSSIEAPVAPGRRASKAVAAQMEAACDVVLVDYDASSDSASGRAAVSSLERLARRLRVPIYDREWAIKALLQGRLPDDFPLMQQQAQAQEEAATPTLLGGKGPGVGSPARGLASPAQRVSVSSHRGWGGGEQGQEQGDAAPAAAGRVRGAKRGRLAHQQQQQQDEEEGEEGEHAREEATGRKPRRRSVHHDSSGLPECPQQHRRQKRRSAPPPPLEPAVAVREEEEKKGEGEAQQQQQQPPHAGAGTHYKAQQHCEGAAAITWVGSAQAPPKGLPATAFRQYYTACAKGGVEMRVGDVVELASAGEECSRLAEVQALWSERAAGQAERMLGRFRRYYRPQDTLFEELAAPAELFWTSHVDDRVPLAAVLGRCTVLKQLPGQPRAATPAGAFFCRFQYDFERGALSVLSDGGEA